MSSNMFIIDKQRYLRLKASFIICLVTIAILAIILIIVSIHFHRHPIVSENLETTSVDKSSSGHVLVSDRFHAIYKKKNVFESEILFYDEVTGVEYLSYSIGSTMGITVLLNADGTPIIYEGD